jgi:NADPH:quinone reductase-like Zn-dependent oxidoreductase
MAMGIYSSGSSPASLGLEVSGTITRVGSKVSNIAVGDRIMGLSWEHCFSTHPLLRSALCVKIPDNLGFEAAATMPSVYVSTLQALNHVGRLQRGDVREPHAMRLTTT